MNEDYIIIGGIIAGLLMGIGAVIIFFRYHKADKARVEAEMQKVQELAARLSVDISTLQSMKAPALKLVEPLPSKVEPPSKTKEVLVPSKTVESALQGTKSGFMGRLKGLFSTKPQLGLQDLELLEEILYTSDLGPKTVQRLMGAVEGRLAESGQSGNLENVRMALRDEMLTILDSTKEALFPPLLQPPIPEKLQVWMIVGVNGAGKTTTIGKLAHRMSDLGHKVLIAAGDTFRAAAGEQLRVWSERAKVEIFSPEGVTSPSAVAFDACKKASGGDYTLLIVDTAGRLHTQKHLMDELVKMKRVVEKAIPGAPHEVLLVLDANAGQNALIQAREFHQALKVSGAVLTKMDGTAKGGVAVGVTCEVGIPVRLIGIGEGMDDLKSFNSVEFVESII